MGRQTAQAEAFSVMAAAMYEQRFSVVRTVSTNDGRGGVTEAPNTIASGVPGLFKPYPTGQREVAVAGQLKGVADGDVRLPAVFNAAHLDLRETDQLVMAALGSQPQQTLHVVTPSTFQGTWIKATVRVLGA